MENKNDKIQDTKDNDVLLKKELWDKDGLERVLLVVFIIIVMAFVINGVIYAIERKPDPDWDSRVFDIPLYAILYGFIGSIIGGIVFSVLNFLISIPIEIHNTNVYMKYSKTLNTSYKKNDNINDAITSEIIQLLKMIQDFQKDPFWKEESGLVMLIPVNENGELYSYDSNKIQISVLLYESNIDTIRMLSGRYDVSKKFDLVSDGTSYSYKTLTICSFNSSYKSIMSKLNKKIAEAFPNTRFEFDGSRLMTKKM